MQLLNPKQIAGEGNQHFPSLVFYHTHRIVSMEPRKFLTYTLAANLAVAIASGWQLLNKVLVIVNALAVLALISLKLVSRKEGE